MATFVDKSFLFGMSLKSSIFKFNSFHQSSNTPTTSSPDSETSTVRQHFCAVSASSRDQSSRRHESRAAARLGLQFSQPLYSLYPLDEQKESQRSSELPQVRSHIQQVATEQVSFTRTPSSKDSSTLSPHTLETDEIWLRIRSEARAMSEAEPALASYLYSTVLTHRSLERSLAFHLANKLSSTTLLSTQLFSLISDILMDDEDVRSALRLDMVAVFERDAACDTLTQCMLNFKGYLALQTHRVAHKLWRQGREALALALQSRVSEVFHVDIHPAAKIGKGVMFDHATGIVVGETAEIGNDVSILHHVTLGGTGAVAGDRHPKICDGVLIGAGATILGNIEIGEGAKIGAGSMVLSAVPPHTTAVGNPARLMGGKANPSQLKEIPSETMDHTSFMGEWSNYVI